MNIKSGAPFIYSIGLIVLLSPVFAEHPTSSTLHKPSTFELSRFSGNQIRNWIGNDGHIVSHRATGDAGLEWPTGSGKTAVYASGIWVIGTVDGDIRSAAAEFTSEWVPGTIPYDTETQLPTSDSPVNTPDEQIYIIERGNNSDLSSPNYSREYATWPSSDGAPAHDGEYFEDLNGNGVWDGNETYADFDQDGDYDAPDGIFVTGEDPPEFNGDKLAWYVMNGWHADQHSNLWSTQPLGLETHVLISTRSDDPTLSNVQFHTFTLVNKGGQPIDEAYFGYWCDADVGDANDDYVGCDPDLSLGYAYNATVSDLDYGLRPPAVGYSIQQGPMIPSAGDTVRYGNDIYPDRRTLGMTAFYKYTSSSPVFHDPENAEEGYNMLQGLGAQGDVYHEYLDPEQPITKFLYPGDPVTGCGWTEYDDSSPGDRRYLMSAGPFDMEPWDDLNNNGKADFGEPGVQMVHTALIVVSGANNLSAITNLKFLTAYAQSTFETGLQVDPPPELPGFLGSGHDQEVILNWQNGSEAYESSMWGSYQFEGYELYQGATSQGPWTHIMGFDIINDVGTIVNQYLDEDGLIQNIITHTGNNQGLERIVSITEDALAGGSLVNGETYHFAFSTYWYNAASLPSTVESPLQIVSVQAQQNQYGYHPRDLLAISHNGSAGATVSVEVLDPSQISGADYEIGFNFDSTTMSGSWHLLGAEDTLLVENSWPGQFYLDGFEFTVSDISFEAPRLNTSWEQTSNTVDNYHETLELLAVSPGGVDSLAWTDETMTSMVHMDTLYGRLYPWDYFEREDRGAETWFMLHREIQHEVFIQAFASHFGGIGGDRLSDIPGVGGGSAVTQLLQGDLEVRFTESGQSASLWNSSDGYTPRMITIPFEVWDIEQNIQLCIGIMDNNNTGGIQDTTLTNWESSLDLDWVVAIYQDYTAHGDSLQELIDNPHSGWCWQFNHSTVFSIGDELLLRFLNPVIPGTDVYTWTTAGSSGADDPENPNGFELKQLRVYPNPFNPSTTIHYRIPEQADVSIHIYDLLGREIWSREISGNPAGYGSLEWNGLNDRGKQASSGVYLIMLSTAEFRLVQKALLIR